MKIESIQLYNFRQFKGEHKLTFSMSSDKNVSVIMGEMALAKQLLNRLLDGVYMEQMILRFRNY